MLEVKLFGVGAFFAINAFPLLVYKFIVFFEQSQQVFLRSTLSFLGILVLTSLYLGNYDRVLCLFRLR